MSLLQNLQFTKMHALGNDFIVIDTLNKAISLPQYHIKQLADRRYGIGCDQVLVLQASNEAHIDFEYLVYNQDGREAKQCGNGLRCLAKYILQHKLINRSSFTLKGVSGLFNVDIEGDFIQVNMGLPQFSCFPNDKVTWQILFHHENLQFGVVNIGNLHAIVKKEQGVELTEAAKKIRSLFSQAINISLWQRIRSDHICIETYENGVGKTLACGSAACAAVVMGRIWKELAPDVTVTMPGGDLSISWDGDNIWMKGDATYVFEGRI